MSVFVHPGDMNLLRAMLKATRGEERSQETIAATAYNGTAEGRRVGRVTVRARTKNGVYVLMDLSGSFLPRGIKKATAFGAFIRCFEMPRLAWETATRWKLGFAEPRWVSCGAEGCYQEQAQEFWMTVSDGMVVLSIGGGFHEVSGLDPSQWIGQSLRSILLGGEDVFAGVRDLQGGVDSQATQAEIRRGTCWMRTLGGTGLHLDLCIIRLERDPKVIEATVPPGMLPRHPLLVQARVTGAAEIPFSSLSPGWGVEPGCTSDIFAGFNSLDTTPLVHHVSSVRLGCRPSSFPPP
jgi:hypothetical protein